MSNDESYQRSVLEISTIMDAVPLIHLEMTGFIESLKPKLGFVRTERIHPLVEELAKNIKDAETLKHLLNQTLIDVHLNDVGTTRNIRFNASNKEIKINSYVNRRNCYFRHFIDKFI